MTFRGTEGLPNPFTEDFGENTLTMEVGVSPQSLEALAFFERNRDKNGNNYIYGHSKGGELATEVYVENYNDIKGAHIINAQPINPYKLSQDQLDALRLGKFDAIVIDGDIVSMLGRVAYPIRIVANNGKKDGFFDPHSISSMLHDDDGNAIIVKNPTQIISFKALQVHS